MTQSTWLQKRDALHAWVVACTGLPADQVIWARQLDAPRPQRDGVVMKIYVVDDRGFPWVDTDENPLTFADKPITSVAGNVFTLANHGLLTGDGPVWFEGLDLPAPMTEETNYWIIRLSANTFSVAVQFEDTGGLSTSTNPVTPLVLTDVGSGVMTLVSTDDTLRSGQEIKHVQRGFVRSTLQLFSYVNDDTGEDGAIATLRRVANRYMLPDNLAIIQAVGIGITHMERTRAMLGVRDAVLFEPRAWIDIGLSWAYEEEATGGVIGRVETTQEEPLPGWVETVENPKL